ncbi:sigma-70 family RNA polymerase sigma factor [candidate division KSB1 bacterium]|nr:sigma-70 family RNA polymerase sigma factor [candidate division KSB1 bacterium]
MANQAAMIKEKLDDYQLIEAFNQGDLQAFRALFERYQAAILNLCYRLVGHRETAEDLCQEVFLKVCQALSKFEKRSQFSTWIYRIAVNLCLNYRRSRRRAQWLTLEYMREEEVQLLFAPLTETTENQPDLLLERQEREQIIWNAINRLPENQRAALILQRYEGLSGEEIAAILNCSLNSVQSRLHRARENLYQKLLPYLKLF